MELTRKPFQGLLNIIRFNWHFYILVMIVLTVLIPLSAYYSWIIYIAFAVIFHLVLSLIVSFYIYDVSDLYKMNWIPNLSNSKILNVNAGFDETSQLIKNKFPQAEVLICDFYNPKKHTEISIKRARKAYPPHPNTIQINTQKLPFQSKSFDTIIVTFSAHEIRNPLERVLFFKELNRVLTTNGELIITEHLRDIPNSIAYSIGVFHFFSKKTWKEVFEKSDFLIQQEIKTTPFISTFKLYKNGLTS